MGHSSVVLCSYEMCLCAPGARDKVHYKFFVIAITAIIILTRRRTDMVYHRHNGTKFNDDHDTKRHKSRFFQQSPHYAENCQQQHARSSGQGTIVCQSRATHRAHITSSTSCATRCERAAHQKSLTELKSSQFSVLCQWLKLQPDEGGKESGVPEKKTQKQQQQQQQKTT